ncbi:MAG: hypothetical protein J4203_02780 [Candidatus Diapherotrites archaeon]|uniref:DUF1616 domain-containing protein n=1 Tax=Candidatus Iainarchaeum sp. TaxID=3101447 RepID=A0A8T4LA11_9ARCH|nr:hypothetical protein [Candidatus Diapherotrites archaeon]
MWEKEMYLNKSITDILVWMTIAACLLALFLLSSAGSPRYGSALYLKPTSYSNYVNDDTVTFVFGVKNYEATDINYLIEVRAGDYLLKKQSLFVPRRQRLEKSETLSIDPAKTRLVYPAKLRVILSKPGSPEKQAVFYWLKEAR